MWLAHQLALDMPCALKFFIGPDTDVEQYCHRFAIEAKAAAKLSHPNVVRILDSGVWEGRPYIAMELLEGEGLDARLRRRGRLLSHETIVFCHQVGAALTKAHALGIVHRDLKPGNVFLAREHERIVVKLIDFGIAKSSAFAAPPSALTHHETIVGTPAYMSPEQIDGSRPLDGRSDLWSLGAIVFECLTGVVPFDGPTLGDVFSKVMFKPLPVPSQVAPFLPPSLDAWWARAAARDPAARFQTAAELCDALSRALSAGAVPDADAAWWATTGTAFPSSPAPSPSSPAPAQHRTLSGQARQQEVASARTPWWMVIAISLGGTLLLGAMILFAWMRLGPGGVWGAKIAEGTPLASGAALLPTARSSASGVSASSASSVSSASSASSAPMVAAAPEPIASSVASASASAAPPVEPTAEPTAEPTGDAATGRTQTSGGKPKPQGRARKSREWGF